MTGRSITFVAGCLLSFLAVSPALATTYYVRVTGKDSNSGTSPDKAFQTIEKAAKRMSAGDIVYVGAGVYVEDVKIDRDGTAAKPIRFIADTTGAMTGDQGLIEIKRSGKDVLRVNKADYIEIIGFRITSGKCGVKWEKAVGGLLQNCEISGSTDDAVNIEKAAVTLSGCTIRDNNKDGVEIDDDSTVVIVNCEILNNRNQGIDIEDEDTRVTISQCVIQSSGREGIGIENGTVSITNSLITGSGRDGIEIDRTSGGVVVWHSTIAENNGDGLEVKRGSVTLMNSIVAFNRGHGLDLDGGSLTHDYNLVYGNRRRDWDGTLPGAGEINVDPQFVSAGEYHVKPGSPVLNGGIDASAITSVDLDDSTRPLDGGWDFGCYEGWKVLLFTDVSGATGFDVQTTTGHGSGLHWGDLDDDGDLDSIITGSSARLLISNSAGQSFFVNSFGGSVRRQGALVDLDNDGSVDFWAGNDNSYNEETFFANSGTASFSDMGNLGFGDPDNNEGVAAADVNGDGLCDIVMFSADGNWIGLNLGGSPPSLGGTADRAYGLNDPGDRGNGDYCSAGDVNNDGFPDFFYHYNGGKLFLSNGSGTYTRANGGISVVTGNSDKIGSAWGDYDNDGDLDLFVPRYDSNQPGYLWRNDGGAFVEVAAGAGITDTSSQQSSCWGDYDNDGDLDLYITTRSGPNVLYQNQGNGTFKSVNEGTRANGNSHDAVFVDYDNDGDLDLAVVREDTSNVLLRNGTDNTDYLKVRVVGAGQGGTNTAGIGVRVELFAVGGASLIARRDVGVARGYGGAEPLWLHFGGVAAAGSYIVKVYFTSGIVETDAVPQSVSTTIGSRTIPQMLTVEEPAPAQNMQVIQWLEIDPDE